MKNRLNVQEKPTSSPTRPLFRSSPGSRKYAPEPLLRRRPDRVRQGRRRVQTQGLGKGSNHKMGLCPSLSPGHLVPRTPSTGPVPGPFPQGWRRRGRHRGRRVERTEDVGDGTGRTKGATVETVPRCTQGHGGKGAGSLAGNSEGRFTTPRIATPRPEPPVWSSVVYRSRTLRSQNTRIKSFYAGALSSNSQSEIYISRKE